MEKVKEKLAVSIYIVWIVFGCFGILNQYKISKLNEKQAALVEELEVINDELHKKILDISH